MTHQIIVDYIKKTRAAGFTDAALRHELEKSGWPANEIDLAFIESRATDQKPAVEPPPVQSTYRTQPQWEEKKAQTSDAKSQSVTITKQSFAKPFDAQKTPEPIKPLGAPTGTIGESRVAEIQKTFTSPARELKEPEHLKELPQTGTPDIAKTLSLNAKISEVKGVTPEPLIMGIPESQLIKPVPRVEPPKLPVVEIKKVEPASSPELKSPVVREEKPELAVSPISKPMQKAVAADLVGGGIAASGAGQSMISRPSVLGSAGALSPQRSRRVLMGVFIAAFFFVASGATAGFWYYQTTLKPRSTVKGAFTKVQNMKSYKYNAELQIKAHESDATLGRSVRLLMPPLASFAMGAMMARSPIPEIVNESYSKSYSFSMRAQGAIDAHDSAKPKSETTLTVGTKDLVRSGFPDSNTEFQSKLVDGMYYFQVSKMPFFDSAMVDTTIPRFTSADITGRWVSVNTGTFERDFNNYAKELSELEPSFVGYHLDVGEQQDLITQQQTKDIAKAWGETRLIVWDDKIVREEENGIDRYRVRGTLDKDSFKRFIAQLAEIEGGMVSGKESKEATDKLFSLLDDIEINAWIDKDSGNLARFTIKAGSSFAVGDGKQGIVEFHLTTDLSDIDSPMSIAAPSEHYDVNVLLEKLFAYAREGFASGNPDTRDMRRISDLSRIRTALELYKKSDGAYPVKLSSLVSEYMAIVPFDPLTKKQYRYTRTANSYTLSAELENKKNPVLKQDTNPANTLYDVGPAL